MIQPCVCRGIFLTLCETHQFSLQLFFCIFRGDKRLAEGRGGVDEDAGGEPHPQGEDPAHAGRHPEE